MSCFSEFNILFHTVRHLKPIQFIYRLKYKLCRVKIPVCDSRMAVSSDKLIFQLSVPSYRSYYNCHFVFLNCEKYFDGKIDWEYAGYGRLWTYNLNYFEFLNQEDMNQEEGCELIREFLATLSSNKTAWEPYPLSLRIISWIRFFLRYKIREVEFDISLYQQLMVLSRKLEYHLLGNHLLENGFALLFGAYYFNHSFFYQKACKILIPQLKEQILEDGGHFERSPMYHSIMLYRVLDCYNLVLHNEAFGNELIKLLKEKAERMLGWLSKIVYSDGSFPLMNDAAFGIAPTYIQLADYAGRLGIDGNGDVLLGESGYRKLRIGPFELLADVGCIGPDYQPGHAHADTFSFELHVNGRPVVIDTGTSTYEINETRFYERSTRAHNTIVIKGRNSSEVWGGHRVARRAKVKFIEDSPDYIEAIHNGYKHWHRRQFRIHNNGLQITDQIEGEGIAYFHFAPEESYSIVKNIIIGKDYIFSFEGAVKIQNGQSWYAPEFNKRITNCHIAVTFKNKLILFIQKVGGIV